MLSELWPVLLRCQNYDKPSIQTLLDKIYLKLDKDFDSFENRVKLDDTTVNLAFDFCDETRVRFDNSKRLDSFNIKSQQDTHYVSDFMETLFKIARESTLSWKNQSTSYGSILYLFYSCQIDNKLLRPECVELFVDSLVHENIHVRKVCGKISIFFRLYLRKRYRISLHR